MSHLALRRVIIRLLHDPEFVAAVHREPAVALAGLAIDVREREWLTAVPPAAWRADPDRPARVLAGLCDELPVATALAPAHTGAFFGSAAFHDAVQQRGSLALALGAHLSAHPDPNVADLARLETAIATVRRAPRWPPASGAGCLRRTPRAAVVTVAAGTLACWQAVRAGGASLAPGAGREHVLTVRAADGPEVTAEEIPDGLCRLLGSASDPRPRRGLVALVRELGGEAGEDEEVVAGLERDGLLI